MGTPNASRVLLYSTTPRSPASAAPVISAASALSPRASHRSMASGDGERPSLAAQAPGLTRRQRNGQLHRIQALEIVIISRDADELA